MSSPAQQLASFAQQLRARLDAGQLPRPQARLAFRRAAQRLLALYPRDEPLGQAFQVALDAHFVPPAPTELPGGSPLAVWRALETRPPEALDALAATVLEPPDPATDPAQAARVMELFLAAPAAADRAASFLERLRGHAPEGAVALWALRLAASQLPPDSLGDPATWDHLLEPVLGALAGATGEDEAAARAATATALRLAAAAVIGLSGAPGSQWMAPVLGGRRVANVSLALARRPALSDDLAPALRWLRQAEDLSPGRAEGDLEGLVSAADEADRAGRLGDGTARLLRALGRSAEREDLAEAVAARARALLDPALWDRAAEALAGDATEGAGGDQAERIGLAAARAWVPTPPTAPPPSPPADGWESLLPRLGAPTREAGSEPPADDATGGAPLTAEDLALLEAAGSVQRAARGWLARGDVPSLLQAARLASALDDAARRALIHALEAVACPDEEVLVQDPTQRTVAEHLLALAPRSPTAPLWELRLRAVAAAGAADRGGAAPADGETGPTEPATTTPQDDPHSPASRLAAAADLLAAGNLEAAGAILGALLRKLDAPQRDAAALRGRLVTLAAELLRQDDPPTAFVGQAARALTARGPVAEALIARLLDDPAAAFPLHDSLRRAAEGDRDHGDLRRVRLLQAWLGIWRATCTPPALDATRSLMRHAPYRLALAGFRAAGREDPVAEAVDFVARHPPRKVTAEHWADAFAAL